MAKRKTNSDKKNNKASELSSENNVVRFIGISLAGGKSDKACVAILEYYPENRKLFLSKLNLTNKYLAI
jgi:hypothetical protein